MAQTAKSNQQDPASSSSESSSAPKPAVRKKKWAAKTKTGCMTCRLRRVKCDEAKPTCRRCATAKRKCDGYQSNRTQSPSSSPSDTLVRQPGHSVMPLEVNATWDQMQVFHYLRTEAAARMSGPFDKDFWTLHLLRSTQAYPVIWYASNALAAMCKRFTMTEDTPADRETRGNLYSLALAQYSTAMNHFSWISRQENLGTDDKKALLTACVLFIGLCNMSDQKKEALTHAVNGLRLFNLWKLWEGPRDGILPINSLVTLFNRVDSQALSMLDDATKVTMQPSGLPREVAVTPFASVTEAYSELELLLNGLIELLQGRDFIFITKETKPIPEARLKYSQAFDAWSAKFAALQLSPHATTRDGEAILSLRIRKIVVDIVLNLDITEFELCWDSFYPEFRQIVDLSEQLLQLYHPCADGQPLPTYSFSATVCDPLYLVADSCRDGMIRRKALSLMRRWPRREGLWDSRGAAGAAEAVMHLEEEGPDAGDIECDASRPCVRSVHICRSHRVLDMDLEIQQNRLVMRRVGDVLHGLPGRTVYLQRACNI